MLQKETSKRHEVWWSTGYDGSDQLLRVADDVAELANDLYSEMYEKNSPRRERRAARRD